MQAGALTNTQAVRIWRAYFGLATLQGLLVVVFFFRVRSEVGVLFGLSVARFLLALLLVGVTLACGILWAASWRAPQKTAAATTRLELALQRPALWGTWVVLTSLAFLVSAYLLTLTPEVSEPFSRAFLDRLTPLILWVTGMSLLTLLTILILRYGNNLISVLPRSKVFYFALGFSAFIFWVWRWVREARLPVERQVVGWNNLGIPILETQVMLAWLGGVAMLAFLTWRESHLAQQGWLRKVRPRTIDWVVCLVLWAGSAFLWNIQPVTTNWFTTVPRAPNYEYYPNQDALLYDMSAQVFLVGEGFQFVGSPIIRRPLYALLLAGLHLLGGQDFSTIVSLQVFVLALLPAIFYLVARVIDNRVSALIAALLMVLREMNSIAISGNITASHAKSLMADLPSTLAVLSFTLVTLAWLRRIDRNQFYPLLAGGVLGFTMLIRPEFGALLFPTGLISLLVLRGKLRPWARGMGLLVLGLALVLGPWFFRNWRITGSFMLDSADFRLGFFTQRYLTQSEIQVATLTPRPPVVQFNALPTQPSQATPQTVPTETPQPVLPPAEVANQTAEFVRDNAGEVARFILAHYTNSQLQPYLILPTTVRTFDSLIGFLGHRDPAQLWFECCSIKNYVRRMPYWHKWDGVFPSQAFLPIILNILILAVGVSTAWKRQKWIGLFPLAIAFTHFGLNAVVRNSGGRYILTVDWISMLYYGIGLAQLTVMAINLFRERKISADPDLAVDHIPPAHPTAERSLLRSPRFYGTAILLFLLGCALPLIEHSLPSPYPDRVKNVLLASLQAPGVLSEGDLMALNDTLRQTVEIDVGRALYPRYYPAGEGEPGGHNLMGPQPYSRLGFYVAGPVSRGFLMPYNQKPDYFPNGADTLVFRDQMGETLAVAVFSAHGKPEAIYFRTPIPPETP